MAASRGDFKGALGALLAAYLTQVWPTVFRGQHRKPVRRQQRRAMQMRGDVEQVGGGVNADAVHQHGFVGVGGRKYQRALRCACSESSGERTSHGTQLPGERQLTDELNIIQCCDRDLAGSGENAECDRQIETPAFLGQIGGREVDGNAARGKLELGGEQRAAHPVAAFFHLGLGQADDGQTRQTVGQMHLDRDGRRINAGEGAAVHNSE